MVVILILEDAKNSIDKIVNKIAEFSDDGYRDKAEVLLSEVFKEDLLIELLVRTFVFRYLTGRIIELKNDYELYSKYKKRINESNIVLAEKLGEAEEIAPELVRDIMVFAKKSINSNTMHVDSLFDDLEFLWLLIEKDLDKDLVSYKK